MRVGDFLERVKSVVKITAWTSQMSLICVIVLPADGLKMVHFAINAPFYISPFFAFFSSSLGEAQQSLYSTDIIMCFGKNVCIHHCVYEHVCMLASECVPLGDRSPWNVWQKPCLFPETQKYRRAQMIDDLQEHLVESAVPGRSGRKTTTIHFHYNSSGSEATQLIASYCFIIFHSLNYAIAFCFHQTTIEKQPPSLALPIPGRSPGARQRSTVLLCFSRA